MDELPDADASSSIWLNLSLNPNVSPALIRAVRAHFSTPQLLLSELMRTPVQLQTPDDALNQRFNSAINKPSASSTQRQVDLALQWQSESWQNHLIGLDHPHYPELLRSTANAPPVLYVQGNLACLNAPCVAIVGARKATHAALEHASEIACQLSRSGICVVSGLALGVDAAAHTGALKGSGQTIAVAATGMDTVYPKSHQALAKSIVSSGAVVTEFPLHNSLRPHCFPRRNRIISGISLGVLVVEAALPSGTLTTAQHALQQGREVMAIPGSTQNPLTRGCHELLKNGAALIENASDVIACLGVELARHCVDATAASPPDETKNLTSADPDTITLLDCLGFDPVSIDTLVRRTGLETKRVSGALTHLELSGVIVADHGGRYSRCKQSSG